ncbi:unnamed protein product [Phaeothamnion confervicola]
MVKGCIDATCAKQASYGWKGSKPMFCKAHKAEKMVYVSKPLCSAESCERRAYFGVSRDGPQYCAVHKQPRAINLYHRRCCDPDCASRPSYARPGCPATFCAQHRELGMVDVVHGQKNGPKRPASRPGSKAVPAVHRPVYGMPTSPKRPNSSSHNGAEADTVDSDREGARTPPLHSFPRMMPKPVFTVQQGLFIARHKDEREHFEKWGIPQQRAIYNSPSSEEDEKVRGGSYDDSDGDSGCRAAVAGSVHFDCKDVEEAAAGLLSLATWTMRHPVAIRVPVV